MCLGIPMRVTKLLPPNKALVESGRISMEASLLLVDEVKVGDYVLVHAGFALEVMDVESAEETLRLLQEMVSS
jgi:hydrogenase expression/formation protein HypC